MIIEKMRKISVALLFTVVSVFGLSATANAEEKFGRFFTPGQNCMQSYEAAEKFHFGERNDDVIFEQDVVQGKIKSTIKYLKGVDGKWYLLVWNYDGRVCPIAMGSGEDQGT